MASGDLFLPTDGMTVERSDGVDWQPWGPIFPLTRPPALSTWAWVNQGTATASEGNGGIFITTPATSNFDAKALVRSAPSTPYTITAAIMAVAYPYNYVHAGVCWRQSSDGKQVVFALQHANGHELAVEKYINPTTYNANYGKFFIGRPSLLFLRIADDGTNRICSWGLDGQNFIQFHSVGRTDFLTADQVGITVKSQAASALSAMTVLSWKEE